MEDAIVQEIQTSRVLCRVSAMEGLACCLILACFIWIRSTKNHVSIFSISYFTTYLQQLSLHRYLESNEDSKGWIEGCCLLQPRC